MKVLREWLQRHFSDPQVVILAMALLGGFLFIVFLGRILTPVLAGLILAYLLNGFVDGLQRRRVPRGVSVMIVFSAFMAGLVLSLFVLMPILTYQVGEFVREIPRILTAGQQALMRLPERYPEFVSETQVEEMMTGFSKQLASFGQGVLSLSVEGVRSLITLLVYLILVPLMVFFFLKDKDRILAWAAAFLPEDRALTTRVWRDVDRQIGNYIRGKLWEILLVWVASYVTFTWLELSFAMLLSVFVGLSVLVPYIGATVMTLPVAIIGFYDFGLSREFAYVLVAYGIIQLLDGNLLAPLLLSEVVDLHPVAIIVAVLVFGGLWGFWGVFFAIPLATLIQSVLKAWPRRENGHPAADIAPDGENANAPAAANPA